MSTDRTSNGKVEKRDSLTCSGLGSPLKLQDNYKGHEASVDWKSVEIRDNIPV